MSSAFKSWYSGLTRKQKLKHHIYNALVRVEDFTFEKTKENFYLDSQTAMKPFCFLLGHSPEMDMCGRPEHDFCAYCGKLTPGQAKGRSLL